MMKRRHCSILLKNYQKLTSNTIFSANFSKGIQWYRLFIHRINISEIDIFYWRQTPGNVIVFQKVSLQTVMTSAIVDKNKKNRIRFLCELDPHSEYGVFCIKMTTVIPSKKSYTNGNEVQRWKTSIRYTFSAGMTGLRKNELGGCKNGLLFMSFLQR